MVADDVDLRQTFEAVECLVYILMQTVNSQLYWPANRLDEEADKLVKMVQKKRAEAQDGETPVEHLREKPKTEEEIDNVVDFLLDTFERLSARVGMLMNHVPVDSLDLLEKKLVNLVLEKKNERLALQIADDRSFQ